MNAPHHTRILLPLLATLCLALNVSPTTAATFQWINPDGGAWEGSNWSRPGYPRYLWDFAVFNLEAGYAVDASDYSQIPGLGGILVEAGDVSLTTHDTFTSIIAVGTTGRPGALNLRSGAVDGAGTHAVGAYGVLTLEPGASVTSRTTSSIGFDIESGGVLRGNGGSLENHVLRNLGTVSPGLGPGQPGTILLGTRLPAGYVQRETGNLEIEIGGVAPGTGHDQLRVESTISPVTLDGTLTVSLLPGYIPGNGDRFDILTAPEITGTFASASLPDLQGFEFSLVYEPTKVTVVATGSAPAAGPIALDIRPGSCPNPLNPLERGVLPAALLGAADLDVHDIDLSTVRLEGVSPKKWHYADEATPYSGELCGCSDEGADGFEDLVLKFYVPDLLLAIAPVEAGDERAMTVTGNLLNGAPFEARDCVRILRSARAEDHHLAEHGTGRGYGKGLGVHALSAPTALQQRVSYIVPEAGEVKLTVYTVTGRKVTEIVRTVQSVGEHSVEWDAGNIPSGLYVYRLQAGSAFGSAKLMLLR